ncbi:hypothetical protein ACTXT7_009732 [Hymenolepis weldensis]
MSSLLALIFTFLPHINNGLLIGVGKFDITGPIVRVDFMGYGDPFQTGNGLHLRLYSRAFIFQADPSSKPVLFISLDAGMASQLIKTQLVRLLQEEYGKDVFDHKNVMISATHTHSGPGGYFQYLLYDITTFGFSNDTFVTMTAGIFEAYPNVELKDINCLVKAIGTGCQNAKIERSIMGAHAQIDTEAVKNFHAEHSKMQRNPHHEYTVTRRGSVKQAYESRTPGHIFYASGTLKGASINRSPFSYLQNPVNERKLYSSNVDETMHLVKLVGSDGRELGMINWFPVHATSMNKTNRLVSSDNKGLASVLFEQWKKDTDGNDKFVAAFAQANEGDVSPNTRGANCVDTGEQCDLLSSTCSDGKSLADDAIKPNIMKAKRQLFMLRPAIKSKMLSIKTQAKLLETFIEPVLLYDFSIIVYRKVDVNKLKVVQNADQGMMLGLYSRQQTSVKVLTEKKETVGALRSRGDFFFTSYSMTTNSKLVWNVQNCIAYGPGNHGDMFESTRIIGQLQFEKARELYTEARLELFDNTKDAVEFRHQFVNMTSYKVTYDTDGSKSPKTGQTCLPALGYSFGAGTTDGPGVSDFTQGMLKNSICI